MRARGAYISLAALVVVSVLLAGYLVVGILKLSPFEQKETVTLELQSSGGLLPNSRVLHNGIEVGRVTRVQVGPDGLAVSLSLDPSSRIPTSASVDVENLSLVGEQYVNFSSSDADGPYLRDGAVIDDARTASTVGELLPNLRGLLDQIDPDRLRSIASTINAGWIGRDQDLGRIGEFSSLFSRTVTTQRTEFSALFDHAQELAQRLDGYGPVLSQAAPFVDQARVPFATLWSLFPGLATATDGAVGWNQVVIPFVAKLNAYFQRLLPKTTPVIEVLAPLLRTVAPGLQVDVGSLVERGLQIVDENGVARFTANVPR